MWKCVIMKMNCFQSVTSYSIVYLCLAYWNADYDKTIGSRHHPPVHGEEKDDQVQQHILIIICIQLM